MVKKENEDLMGFLIWWKAIWEELAETGGGITRRGVEGRGEVLFKVKGWQRKRRGEKKHKSLSIT